MKFNSRAPAGKKGGARTKKFFAGGGVGDDTDFTRSEDGAQTSPVPDQPKLEERPLTADKRKSFKEAFAEARAKNPGKNFSWTDAKGVTRSYTTDLAKPGSAKPASKPAAAKAEFKPDAPKAEKSVAPEDIPGTQPVPKRSKADDDKPLISEDTERQLGNIVAGLPVGRAALGAVRGAGKLVTAAKGALGARKAMDEATFVGRGPRERMDGGDMLSNSAATKALPAPGPKRLEGPKDSKASGDVSERKRLTWQGGAGDRVKQPLPERSPPTKVSRRDSEDSDGYKRGGKVKAFAKGGFVRSADGIAKRGHTKGRKC